MFFVKRLTFCNDKFLCKKGKKKLFFEGPKRKEDFLDQKKHRLKKTTKICIFSNGLVRGLCQKMEIFNIKFLCKTDQEIVFCEGYEGKEAFLDNENIGIKNHHNLHFFKGVSPWFL